MYSTGIWRQQNTESPVHNVYSELCDPSGHRWAKVRFYISSHVNHQAYHCILSSCDAYPKMAASETSHGYQCQFIDSVAEDFYCKQCGLVARKLTCTGCCGETYCYGCIRAVQQHNKPCPECAQQTFEIFQQVKYQRKISALHVYCSLKERGCGWSGPLASLEAHLDPDTGDCEYTDVPCPLKCSQKVSKKTLEHHTAEECAQRDYICPYCAFKATYKIVTKIHWPECSYFTMDCPSLCGMAFERPTLEDHMRMCPLGEVVCHFEHVGCLGKFRREEEQHMREKSQTHLNMMAAAYAKMQLDFRRMFDEQQQKFVKRFEEQEGKFEKKLKEQERKFEEQAQKFEGRFEEQEQKLEQMKLEEQERKFEKKLEELEQKLEEQVKKFESKFEEQEQKLEEQVKKFESKFKEQEQKFEEQEKKRSEEQKAQGRSIKELRKCWKHMLRNLEAKRKNSRK